MRFLALVLLMSFTGCVALQSDNIIWAEKNKNLYSIIRVPDTRWPSLAKEKNFDPIHPCFFLPPSDKSQTPYLIFVRQGSYVYKIVGDVKLKQTYEDYCLDHELGHLREYMEGVPYHSKYAR